MFIAREVYTSKDKPMSWIIDDKLVFPKLSRQLKTLLPKTNATVHNPDITAKRKISMPRISMTQFSDLWQVLRLMWTSSKPEGILVALTRNPLHSVSLHQSRLTTLILVQLATGC